MAKSTICRILICTLPSVRTHGGAVKGGAARLELIEVLQPAAAASLLELLDLLHELLVEGHCDAAAAAFVDHPAHHVVDLGRTPAHSKVAPGARVHFHL